MTQPATASLMRSINRTAVLDLIREHSPISRSRIGRELNMSLPTVMRIVEQLQEEDLVRLTGTQEATGGRPSTLIEFNGNAHAVIGVDLGGTKMFGTVANLAGQVQHERYLPHKDNCTPEDYVEELCGFIETLLVQPRQASQHIRGIGVGVPAAVLIPDGIVTWAPSLGWRDLPLQDMLSERFEVPVFVENDVNLTALGELGFGAGRGAQNLVSIAIGTGIGAGIIIGGALYRGHHQAAGEVGYLPPGVEFLGRRYDEFGALESLASGSGIAERARQILAQQASAASRSNLTAHQVFDAARNGEAWARQVVDETVDYLGLAIASISALIDPDIIILGGGVAQSADLLIEPILQRVAGVVPFMPRLVASPLGRRAAAMGAIMMVLKATTDYTIVKQLP